MPRFNMLRADKKIRIKKINIQRIHQRQPAVIFDDDRARRDPKSETAFHELEVEILVG